MSELWRVLREPRVSIALTLALLGGGGVLLLSVGWRGAAASLFVPYQLPYLVSGGFLGLAVLGAALALITIHVDRTEAALEREQFSSLQREALSLLALTPGADPARDR
ncbi:MAG: hypothetical protein M3N21_00550 [Actinomycetota bacterium]|nr:hypothetical protein [Actinomycetota bacterium]